MDVGLFAIRLAVGVVLTGHGTQKLFGWFEGPGLRRSAGFFAKLGYPAAPLMAWLAALGETLGGLGLALGALTPLSAAAGLGVMLNAVAAHHGKGPWATRGGWEYPLVLATISGALAFTGPGRFSLDALVGLAVAGLLPGLLAVGLGAAAAAFVLLLRRSQPSQPSQPSSPERQPVNPGDGGAAKPARARLTPGSHGPKPVQH